MYFDASISVTIGNKILQTVGAVSIENDSKSIGSDCDIVVPLNCRIQYADGTHDYLTDVAKNLFSTGDEVVITAMYGGYDPVKLFDGYVVDFIEGTPIKIKCQDQIFLLDQTTVTVNYKSVTLQALINGILEGTGITLMQPILQLNLQNISFKLMSPAAILEWLKKELGLVIVLQNKLLYVQLASNTLNQVNLSTAINVHKSNLQKPSAVFLKLKVKAWFIRVNGTKDSLEVGDENGQLREVFFYKIPMNLTLYNQMANEALVKYKQYRYSGDVETFLYPDIQLYDKVNYTDIRYPDKNGNYVCVGLHFDAGREGYHRKIKLSFLSDN
jgi:hypothetical protein